jgi:hypothetical protein
MGDYDLAIEISTAALMNLITTNATVNHVVLSPPFELPIEMEVKLPNGSVPVTAYLIVHNISLVFLPATDKIDITFDFKNASFDIPLLGPLSPLEGRLTVRLRLALTDVQKNVLPGQQVRALTVMMNEAEVVGLDLLDDSMKRISAWAQSLISPEELKQRASEGIQSFMRTQTNQQFEPFWLVEPGRDGDLSDPNASAELPRLRLVRLDKIYAIDADTLCIFGIMLAKNEGKGAPEKKSAIRMGRKAEPRTDRSNYNVAISISPETFNQLILSKLEATVRGQLPLISNVHGTFMPDYINLDIHFDTNNLRPPIFCVQITGLANARLLFSFEQGKLIARVQNLTISYYDTFADHIGCAMLVELAKATFLKDYIDSLRRGLEVMPIEPQTIPLDIGILKFRGLDLTSEGLTLLGSIDKAFSTPLKPELRVDLVMTDVTEERVGDGTFIDPGITSVCAAREFKYEEFISQSRMICKPVPILLGRHLHYEWFLRSYKDPTSHRADMPPLLITTALVPSKGELLLSTSTFFEMPLPMGREILSYSVTIHYEIIEDTEGSRLELFHSARKDGIYTYTVGCRATDMAGQTTEGEVLAQIRSSYTKIEPEYERWKHECLVAYLQKQADEAVQQEIPTFEFEKPIPIEFNYEKLANDIQSVRDQLTSLTRGQ